MGPLAVFNSTVASATLLYRIGEELYNVTKVSRGINPTWVWAIKLDNSSSFLVEQKMLEGLHIAVTVHPIHTYH